MIPTVCVVVPVYKDWQSLSIVLSGLDRALVGYRVRVLAVDDCPPGREMPTVSGAVNIAEVRVARLLHNVGHQQAIASGLSYARTNMASDWYVVMDADGEDRPEDVPRLLEKAKSRQDTVVFGARGKRFEGPLFRFSYRCYKVLYWLLVGKVIDFGNFSCIPASLIDSVVSLRQISSHFPSSITHSKLPYCTVPCERGRRHAGESRMNLVSLCLHGLSSISVYSDLVMVRALIFLAILFSLLVVASFAVLYIKFCTQLALPGWATTVMLNLVSLMAQITFMNFICAFLFIHISAQNKQPQSLAHEEHICRVETLP